VNLVPSVAALAGLLALTLQAGAAVPRTVLVDKFGYAL